MRTFLWLTSFLFLTYITVMTFVFMAALQPSWTGLLTMPLSLWWMVHHWPYNNIGMDADWMSMWGRTLLTVLLFLNVLAGPGKSN
jgi:hypothetical protein